jgi:hypothetical protein
MILEDNIEVMSIEEEKRKEREREMNIKRINNKSHSISLIKIKEVVFEILNNFISLHQLLILKEKLFEMLTNNSFNIWIIITFIINKISGKNFSIST